jgi:hypothetical protein
MSEFLSQILLGSSARYMNIQRTLITIRSTQSVSGLNHLKRCDTNCSIMSSVSQQCSEATNEELSVGNQSKLLREFGPDLPVLAKFHLPNSVDIALF